MARAEPRRPIGGNGAAEGLGGGRAAARLADDGRRRGLFVVCDLPGPVVHARRARQYRVCRRLRRRQRQAPVGNGARNPVQQRSRRRSPRHADDRRRSRLRVRRERRSQRARCGERQGPLDRQRAQAVPRFEHPVGAERVAARSGGPDSRERRRDDRRAQEDRRQQDLDEPKATKRATRRPCITRPAPSTRRSSSRAGGCSASTSTPAGGCGAMLRSPTTSPTSRRRSCAAIACSCRRTTVPASALLELTASGNNVSAKEVYFTRQMKNHHATSILVGEHLYGFDSAILTVAEVRHRRGRLAEPQRREGLADLCRRPALPCTAKAGWSGWPRPPRPAIVEHGRFELKTGRLPTWSHPVVSGGKLFLRDQDVIYAYDVSAK